MTDDVAIGHEVRRGGDRHGRGEVVLAGFMLMGENSQR
jgi:hypothetical protein